MKKVKFVIAPDSFKESLDAFEAAKAMKEGIENIFKDCIFELIPMADGGEGTSEVIISAQKGEFKKVKVTGPLGKEIESKYGYIKNQEKAVIEVAAACGLELVDMGDRNPLYTTTYGVGEMILDALNMGAKHFIIGLGGSATNDGGLGMLQALGAKAYDKNGKSVGLGGKELAKIERIDLSSLDSRLKNITIEVACDVENPLVGTNGATYTFGPQKGADTDILEELEKGMINYSKAIKRACNIDVSNIPKAGAAGGLGGALLLLGCELVKGIEMVLKHTCFEDRVKDADYIFTGEGSIDAQTKYGKTIAGIAKIAKKYNVPTIVLAGRVGDDIGELYDMGVTSVFGIVDRPKNLDEALKDGYSSVKKTSENIARLLRFV